MEIAAAVGYFDGPRRHLVSELLALSASRSDKFQDQLKEYNVMKSMLSLMATFHREESGQGLVEYVLLIALVAFAATAGMSKLASSVNSAFSQVGTILSSYIT